MKYSIYPRVDSKSRGIFALSSSVYNLAIQTTVRCDTLTYKDADGTPHEQAGGGVVVNPDGSERPMTDEEIMEHVMEEAQRPEIDYKKDGSVWVYYMDQAMDITDKFNDDGICFVQLKNGSDILYLTVKYQNGYATSPDGFVQPDEFNW